MNKLPHDLKAQAIQPAAMPAQSNNSRQSSTDRMPCMGGEQPAPISVGNQPTSADMVSMRIGPTGITCVRQKKKYGRQGPSRVATIVNKNSVDNQRLPPEPHSNGGPSHQGLWTLHTHDTCTGFSATIRFIFVGFHFFATPEGDRIFHAIVYNVTGRKMKKRATTATPQFSSRPHSQPGR